MTDSERAKEIIEKNLGLPEHYEGSKLEDDIIKFASQIRSEYEEKLKVAEEALEPFAKQGQEVKDSGLPFLSGYNSICLNALKALTNLRSNR